MARGVAARKVPARLTKKGPETHEVIVAHRVLSVQVVNLWVMRRWTANDLRESTLQRQFPYPCRCGPDAVIELFAALGPIQSQVPRAPFLTAASRLPGVTYATVCGLFEDVRLVKGSNLRGTVHTSTRQDFGLLDAVASRSRRALMQRGLALDGVTPEQVMAEVRRFCWQDWRPRRDIVAHIRNWLTAAGQVDSAARVAGTPSASLVWGDSGLLRRPQDGAWVDRPELNQVWAKATGLFAPVVLHDGRLVATWRTVTQRGHTDLEVRMLSSPRSVAPDLVADAAGDVSAALGLPITDIRVLPAGHD